MKICFLPRLRWKWMIDDEDRNCLIHRSLNSLLHEIIDFMIQNPINKRFKRSRLQCHRGKIKKSREKEHEFGSYRQELEVKQRMNGQLDVINAWKGRTSCTSFVRCNDMWLAKDNRFMNPMSTYEWNLMAPTCLIINYFSCQIPILGSF